MGYRPEIQDIKNQIILKYNPHDLYLFGCIGEEQFTYSTGCNLCLILDTENRQELLRRIYEEVESDYDYDVMIYTKEEWYKNKDDSDTYANIIYRTGISLLR